MTDYVGDPAHRFGSGFETIQIYANGTLSYDELAPFLNELQKRYGWVNVSASSVGNEPPAAGMSEIALIIVPAAVALPYLKSFFEEWGREDAKDLRKALVDVFERGRKSKNNNDRRFIPCQVQLGKVRFYLHQSIDDDEFVKRIEAARQLIESLPDDALEGSAGPGEYGLFWNRETQSWEGSIWEVTEFKGLPDDIWGDN